MNAVQWILYLSTWFLAYILHASNSVMSASNGVNSIGTWFKFNIRPVGYNLLWTVATGLVWHESPTFFNSLTAKMVPITYGTAMGMGLVVQNLVDRFQFLLGVGRVEMPKLVPPTDPPKEVK